MASSRPDLEKMISDLNQAFENWQQFYELLEKDAEKIYCKQEKCKGKDFAFSSNGALRKHELECHSEETAQPVANIQLVDETPSVASKKPSMKLMIQLLDKKHGRWGQFYDLLEVWAEKLYCTHEECKGKDSAFASQEALQNHTLKSHSKELNNEPGPSNKKGEDDENDEVLIDVETLSDE